MQPQDVFNRAMDEAIAAIEQWLPTIADSTAIEREQSERYWRVRLRPHLASACPAELMLARTQVFDCDIGPESVVNEPIADLRFFLPLLQAVTAGHVRLRSWQTPATAREIVREILVDVVPDHTWSIRRQVVPGAAAIETTAVARDHIYLAYARG